MTDKLSEQTRQVPWVALIIGSGMLVQIMYVWLRQPQRPEVWEYETLALNFLNGKGLTINYFETDYRALFHPFYPLLSVGIYKFFGVSHIALIFMQIIFFGLVSLIIYLIGKKVFDDKTATIATLLIYLHPGLFIYTTGKLHPLIIDAFWFSLLLYYIANIRTKANLKRAVLGGIILGTALLSRSTILLFAGVVSIWLLKQWEFSIRKRLLYLSILALTSAIIVAPWTIRNYVVLRHFIPITSSFGYVLWIGNNPNATGTPLTPSGEAVISKDAGFLQRLAQFDELGQARLFKEAALRYIGEHPLRALQLYLKKIYYFWWFSPQSGLWYHPSWLMLYKLGYGGVLVLALIGVWMGWKGTARLGKSDLWVLLLLFLLSVSVFQSIFFVEGRHRWAVEPVLLIFSAEGVRVLWGWIRKLRVEFVVGSI